MQTSREEPNIMAEPHIANAVASSVKLEAHRKSNERARTECAIPSRIVELRLPVMQPSTYHTRRPVPTEAPRGIVDLST